MIPMAIVLSQTDLPNQGIGILERNGILGLLVILILVFAFGFYREWFVAGPRHRSDLAKVEAREAEWKALYFRQGQQVDTQHATLEDMVSVAKVVKAIETRVQGTGT